MAFVLHQSWDATASWNRPASAAILAPLLANGRDRAARKAGATLLSVLVHILLLWLFVSRLAGNVGAGDGAGAGSGALMSFSLSDPSASAASAAQESVQPQTPAAPVTTEVDTSVAADLPPSEWSVSRLPPAPAAASLRESALSGAAPGRSSGAGQGAGSGGSDVYDPYAGAAPLRRDADGQTGGGSLGERMLGFFGFGPAAAGGLVLDEKALETVRLAVARSLPGRRGTADLVVRVSPTGVVLDVASPGGSAPREARDALGRALIGKRLFRGAAADAQSVSLPTLRLG